jgi:hypothetical protein
VLQKCCKCAAANIHHVFWCCRSAAELLHAAPLQHPSHKENTKMKVTKLPSYSLVETNEGKMLFYRLEKSMSKRAAAVKAGCSYRAWSKSTVLRCVDEWGRGEHLIVLEALAQAKEAETRTPPPEDPEIHALLKEIESRGPQAVLTPTLAPVPDRSCVSDELMSTPTPPEPQKPVDDANLSAEQRSAKLAATLARLDAEA